MKNLIGDEALYSIEHRVLNLVLLLGILISLISTIIYYISQQDTLLIATGIMSIITMIGLYCISLINKKYAISKIILIAILGLIFIPLVWVLTGGILGWAPYLAIMYSGMVAILLQGIKRYITIASFIFIILILMMQDYNNLSAHASMYLGMFSSMIIFAAFYVLIIKYYIEEKDRAGNYLAQIEKQEMEIQMARLDRLNVVGEIAASIGHEVRNPMTTVRGYLQLFLIKKDFIQYHGQINTMIGELDRANYIITEFLSIAKDRIVNMKQGNLNDVIHALYPLLQADVLHHGHDIQLALEGIPNNEFDEKEIRQLVLNLVRNGIEAMSNKGLVTIKTGFNENGQITLAIEDTGAGIPAEILEQLGTPFITTKESGTGLGLPICYRVVHGHGAKMDVITGATGTAFIVTFNSSLN